MVAPIIVTVLAYLHIIAAMGWLGGAIFFISAIGPGVRSMSPAASLEFLVKVGPRATRFLLGGATGTIVFGLALLAVLPGLLSTGLMGGVSLGLLAYLIAIVAFLDFKKTDRIAKQTLAGPPGTKPSPDLAKLLKRGGIMAAINVLLLVLALAFMVATGFPF